MPSNRRAVQFGGNSNINITGNMYAPTAAVTFQGNPTLNLGGGNTVANSSPLRSRSMATPPSTTAGAGGGRPGAAEPICAAGAMMRKLDKRGVAALEFFLVVVPLVHIDVRHLRSRTLCNHQQSLNALANAGARAVMINCYTPDVMQNVALWLHRRPPVDRCSKQNAGAVPVFRRSHADTQRERPALTRLTVTASQSGFTMLMPIWGTALNAPSVSTSIPF